MQEKTEYSLKFVEQNLENQRALKVSSTAPEMNIFRNKQNENIISYASQCQFSGVEQMQIMECFRKFNIDYRTLVIFKAIFMDCEEIEQGLVSVEELVNQTLKA